MNLPSLFSSEPTTRTVWMGQQFVDEDTKHYVKRVIMASAIMASVQVLGAVTGTTRNPIRMAIGLLMPICGYLGATRSSATLMGFFCASNLGVMLAELSAVVLLTLEFFGTETSMELECMSSCRVLGCGNFSSSCSCDPSCVIQRGAIACCPDMTGACPENGYWQDPLSCSQFLRDEKGIAAALAVDVALALLCVLAPSILFSAYAWWHGMELWKRLSAGEQLSISGATMVSEQRLTGVEDGDDEVGGESPSAREHLTNDNAQE